MGRCLCCPACPRGNAVTASTDRADPPPGRPGDALSRRTFIGSGLAALGALAVGGCAGGPGEGPAAPVLDPGPGRITVDGATRLRLSWRAVRGARSYDVELNGSVVAAGVTEPAVELAYGDGATGLVEGDNRWRVRARDSASGAWSRPGTFDVVARGAVLARRFDREDDGPIELTTRRASGTTLSVAAAAALGAGKGLLMRGADPADAVASKNLFTQPLSECWLRLAVRPSRWQRAGARVHLARIHSQTGSAAREALQWITGEGIAAESVARAVAPVRAGAWTQAQLGVLADGSVELWTYDGRREHLVGRGRNPGLAGAVKDTLAIGNDLTRTGSTFEVHLDGFAVGEHRLPWANTAPPITPARPVRLDPASLPARFSFCFGSCNNAKSAPYHDTAVGVAARLQPDFFVHLGDYGYPDSNAYRPSVAGYQALWSDLFFEEQLELLSRKPWLYIASDHDMGRNDCDITSCSPVASRAFAQWQNNDPSADGQGRYGSVLLDRGRVLLVWTEGIAYRSLLTAPDGPGKTVLGAKQKTWLLGLLASTTARLVIIASQTSVGFVTGSDWAQYPTERAELIHACQSSPAAAVRFISGDYHHAGWSRFGPKVAEWLAAPMAEFPEGANPPGPLVDQSALAAIGAGFSSRPEALRGESWSAFNASSSVGRVTIDGDARTATFELLDARGQLRNDGAAFTFREIVRYA